MTMKTIATMRVMVPMIRQMSMARSSVLNAVLCAGFTIKVSRKTMNKKHLTVVKMLYKTKQ